MAYDSGQSTRRSTEVSQMARRWYCPVAWATITAFGASCSTASLDSRWQTYQSERVQYEQDCVALFPPHFDAHGTPCHMLYYAQHFHQRWNALIGSVAASEALWADHERMAREWGVEFLSHNDKGTPLRPQQEWVDQARETEERYALPIAQQLADQERTAELRRERALMALYALGLIVEAAAGAVPQPAPRWYWYGPRPSAIPAPETVARPIHTPETCTYRLRALQGRMLCVDNQGNVRAR